MIVIEFLKTYFYIFGYKACFWDVIECNTIVGIFIFFILCLVQTILYPTWLKDNMDSESIVTLLLLFCVCILIVAPLIPLLLYFSIYFFPLFLFLYAISKIRQHQLKKI
jgi:hypothetical protein